MNTNASSAAVCEECGRKFDTEHGVSVHASATHEKNKPYTDAETLRDLYHGEQLSMREVAERLGTDVDRIDYWMDVHDIETRMSNTQQPHAGFRTDVDGYEVWRTYVNGSHLRVRVHRLLAVAEYGLDAVAGNDIHHKNHVPWDNRSENIEPLGPSEHRRRHGVERADEQREILKRLRSEGRLQNGEGA